MIVVSHERLDSHGLEAVIFLDSESGDCFQIQRDLLITVTDRAPVHQVTTGMSAPVPGGIVDWRVVDGERFEFALTPHAARIFGGSDVLSFVVAPAHGTTVDEIVEHVTRLLR
ncbi:hypothetical protein [Williamsia sp. CHRR-6]|uniref:hypothetical protein n=1 Tax=Williamsia sp. CHRR-6 TaxID=2835871 RepID=UPI001BDA8BCA|nr:hypothetical protein [Williamsia sp. CHRR-6]MBT0567220.1 hypothetical protein [Williamsia sp. CHRR-6]